jgi:hypothetical protein
MYEFKHMHAPFRRALARENVSNRVRQGRGEHAGAVAPGLLWRPGASSYRFPV